MPKEDPDYTDDWMNPHRATHYVYKEPQPSDPVRYLIEREKRVICFGNPGSITKWEYWAKYDTEEARDAALKRLHEEHPMWHLRARNEHPYWDRLG
jgi:hypothetical protein